MLFSLPNINEGILRVYINLCNAYRQRLYEKVCGADEERMAGTVDQPIDDMRGTTKSLSSMSRSDRFEHNLIPKLVLMVMNQFIRRITLNSGRILMLFTDYLAPTRNGDRTVRSFAHILPLTKSKLEFSSFSSIFLTSLRGAACLRKVFTWKICLFVALP